MLKLRANLGYPAAQTTNEWVISLVNRGPIDGDESLSGVAFLEAQRITVVRSMDPEETFNTLLHELLHAEFPDLAEDSVGRASRHFTEVLLKLKLIKLASLRRK